MSTSSVHTTAQIIQFPGASRRSPGERNRQATPLADLETQAAAIAAGDAWYHDAAIEDAKRAGGH
jgi:hypothetical protein